MCWIDVNVSQGLRITAYLLDGKYMVLGPVKIQCWPLALLSMCLSEATNTLVAICVKFTHSSVVCGVDSLVDLVLV